jgi:DNA modification methylase
MLLKSIAEQGIKLPDKLKLIEGDFRLVSNVIPDKRIDLIFTDPLYAKKDIDLFTDLGQLAYKKLKEGGNLVTYCGTGTLLEAGNRISSAGLKYVWTFPVILTGLSAAVHPVKINVKYKPLLWFAKGDKPNIFEYTDDLIVSKPPDKILLEWEQSPVEAEFVISKLTLPNQLVFDPMLGTGTTGIAAIRLKRQFIGIEKDPQTFGKASAWISKAFSSR